MFRPQTYYYFITIFSGQISFRKQCERNKPTGDWRRAGQHWKNDSGRIRTNKLERPHYKPIGLSNTPENTTYDMPKP